MKRLVTIILLSVLMVFSACQSPKEDIAEETSTEPFEVSTEAFLYEGTADADTIAVDEEGYLYAVKCITELEEGATIDKSMYNSFTQQIRVYDLQGTCVEEAEIALGSGNLGLLTSKGDKLYCITVKSTFEPVNWGPTLYEIDTKTWEVNEIYFFEKYDTAINFAMVGDYVYMIGHLKDIPEKEYTLHPDIDNYEYRGECISRIKLGEEEIKEQIIPIDFPMDIVGTNKNNLVIYHYNEEKGFGFLEFDTEKATLSEVGWSKKQIAIYNMVQCKDGFLFERVNDLYYGTKEGIETKLSSKDVWITGRSVYQRGFAFYLLTEGVERIGVNNFIKRNTPVNMLLYYEYMAEPYDNGYLVEKMILEGADYELKVLAQDSDFDVCLLSSRDSGSHNLKEKGAFYALNEVPGVMEYLDACFPYLKEAATNEDGDIWMVPVEVTTTALHYDKEYSAMRGVDLSKMNFSEFLTLVEEVETNEPEKGSISTYMLIENLFLQYLQVYDSFDTDVFRGYAKQLKQIEENAGRLAASERYINSIKTSWYSWEDRTYSQEQLDQIPDFLYDIDIYPDSILRTVEHLGSSDIIGVSTMPKMSKDMGNIGTVTLLAVNPNSKNLEFTLEYVSAFCKYMMDQKDTFMLKDETLYTDTPIIKEYYEVFKDGTIAFDMDSDIYWNDFWDYLNGEIELEEMIKEIDRKLQIYMGE